MPRRSAGTGDASLENGRIRPAYTNTSTNFVISKKDRDEEWFLRQYFLLYQTRLALLTNRLMNEARKQLGDKAKPVHMYEMKEDKSDFIYGITIKKSTQRRSVFDEFREPNFVEEEELNDSEQAILVAQTYESVCTASDALFLENDSQRIELRGDGIEKEAWTSGCVLGVYGRKDRLDIVYVEHIIYPTLPTSVPWPLVTEDSWIMFVSGISVNTDMAKNAPITMAFNQLVDWLYGNSSSKEEADLARRVSRVVFAGDTVQISSKDVVDTKITKIGQRRTYDVNALEQTDRLFENIVKTIDCDIMAGQNDIVGPMWPQQPMIRHAFYRCRNSKNFNMVTNPYSFQIDGVNFLGTSGQNLHDLLKFTRGQSVMELMKLTLETSCLCPTCPDTIEGFPYSNRDPLVLEQLPHVYFVGNQADYTCEKIKLANEAEIVMLAVPKFSEKFEAILLNVKTMETKSFVFDQTLEEAEPMEY